MNRLMSLACLLSAAAGTVEGAGTTTDAPSQAPANFISGSIRDPKVGTMRHKIIKLISENGKTTKAELFKEWPSWTDKNFTDCMNILRKRYGYNMQVADDGTVTVGPAPAKGQPAERVVVKPVAEVAGQQTGAAAESGGPEPVIDEEGAGHTEEESETEGSQPADQSSGQPQVVLSKRAQKRLARQQAQG